MQNRRLIVVCNLKPRNLVGFKSSGMVLCAVGEVDGAEKVEFIEPPEDSKPGDRIVGEGLGGSPLTPNQVDKQKAFEAIAADLRVDGEGLARWTQVSLVSASSGKPCRAPSVRHGIMR